MAEPKHNTLYHIRIRIDDFAGRPHFTRNGILQHKLYMRGLHQMVNTTTATQVFKATTHTVRKNITHMYIYRIRPMPIWKQ